MAEVEKKEKEDCAPKRPRYRWWQVVNVTEIVALVCVTAIAISAMYFVNTASEMLGTVVGTAIGGITGYLTKGAVDELKERMRQND